MTYPRGKTIIPDLAFEVDRSWRERHRQKVKINWAKKQAYKQTKAQIGFGVPT